MRHHGEHTFRLTAVLFTLCIGDTKCSPFHWLN